MSMAEKYPEIVVSGRSVYAVKMPISGWLTASSIIGPFISIDSPT
jgi:hypothetical protein